jgi:hypothetical protein
MISYIKVNPKVDVLEKLKILIQSE